jgi:hypothetical protein
MLNICIALVYLLYSLIQVFMYQDEKVNMTILKTNNYFENININVVFRLNYYFYFICKTSLNNCTTLVANFKCLYLRKQIFTYRYEKVDMIKFSKLVIIF